MTQLSAIVIYVFLKLNDIVIEYIKLIDAECFSFSFLLIITSNRYPIVFNFASRNENQNDNE